MSLSGLSNWENLNLLNITKMYTMCLCLQKLYKTQIRELKEECDEKTKLYQGAQQRREDLLEERCVFVCGGHCLCAKRKSVLLLESLMPCLI